MSSDSNDQDEMFDLVADPLETTNLADEPQYAEVLAFLEGVLAAWVDVSFPELEYPTMVERSAELLKVSISTRSNR